MRVLFICGKNRRRSPTAEQVFAEWHGVECASAGLSRDADSPVSLELIEWADLIIVMEKVHRTKLVARFNARLADKRIVCINIPDNYSFMEPALIELLRTRVSPFLPVSRGV